ncbi:hypothetical protein W97_02449 [Coniosporium apollinis CBS 100218]|uniref:Uncharacterized protein n=1 Tax=Coniosporium apollinis (strain CBS 100218) TaxID=1168221 RepID=R7YMU3_CONA1|nr:uncharacterized protein W97_02449 [Coniosporium apollinis CBS 100218]EON63222.1 hypothetical protein W97_02449 [Coniosporium apollinis CBS 100218]
MTACQDPSWDRRTVEIAGNVYNCESYSFHDDPRIKGWTKITHNEVLVAIDEFFLESPGYEVQIQGQPQAKKEPDEASRGHFHQSLSRVPTLGEENSAESLLHVSEDLPPSPARTTEASKQSPPVVECTEEGSLPTAFGGYDGDPPISTPQLTSESSAAANSPQESDEETYQADQDTLMQDFTIDQYVLSETLAAEESVPSSDANASIEDIYEYPLVTSSIQTPQSALPPEESGAIIDLGISNLFAPDHGIGVQTPPPEAVQPASNAPDDSLMEPEAPQTPRGSIFDNDALTPCTPRTSRSSQSKVEQNAALELSSEPLRWRGFDIHADAVAVMAVGQKSSEQLVRKAFENDSVRSPENHELAHDATQSRSPTVMEELHSFERVLKPPTFNEIPALRRSPNPSPEKSTIPVSMSRLHSPEDICRGGGRPRKDGSINVRSPNFPSVRKAPERYLHGQYPTKVYKAAAESNDLGNMMDTDGAGGGDTPNYQDVSNEPTDLLSLRSYEGTKLVNEITDTSLLFPEQANAKVIKGRNNHVEGTEDPKKLMQQEADPSQEELKLADALDYGSPAARRPFTSAQYNSQSQIGPQIQQAYHPLRSHPPIAFSPVPVVPSQRHSVGHHGYNATMSEGHGVSVARPPALYPVTGPAPNPVATAALWSDENPDPVQIRELMQLLASYSQSTAGVVLGAAPPPPPPHLPWYSSNYLGPTQQAGQPDIRTSAQGYRDGWLPELHWQQVHQTWRHPVNASDGSQVHPLLPLSFSSPVAPTVSPITPYVATAPFSDLPIAQPGPLAIGAATPQPHMGSDLPMQCTQLLKTFFPSILHSLTPDARTKRRASSPAGPQSTPKTRAAPGNRTGVLYSTGTLQAAVSEKIRYATGTSSSPSHIRPRTSDEEVFYDADESPLSGTKAVAPAFEPPTSKQADKEPAVRDDDVERNREERKSASGEVGNLSVSSPLSDVPSSIEKTSIRSAITDAIDSLSSAVENTQPSAEKLPQTTSARGRGSGHGRGRVTKPTTAAGAARNQAGRGRGSDTATPSAGRKVPPDLPAVATTPPSRARSGVLSPAQVNSGASQRRGWETRRANAMRKKARVTVRGEGTPAALQESGVEAEAEAEADVEAGEAGEVQSGIQTKPKGIGGKKGTATSKSARAKGKKSGADADHDESVAEPAKQKPRRSVRQSARLIEGPGLAEGNPGA